MSDELALLAAIRDNPDEDTPRLVYADWLQEHDQHERAEFIRLQCAVARMPPGKEASAKAKQAERLLKANKVAWFGPLWKKFHSTKPAVGHCRIDRGFITSLKGYVSDFIKVADQIAIHAPCVRTAHVTGVRDDLGSLLPKPFVKTTRELDFETLHPGSLAVLTDYPDWGAFDALRITFEFDNESDTLAGLSTAPLVRAARRVDLQYGYYLDEDDDDDSEDAAAQAPSLRELRRLKIPNLRGLGISLINGSSAEVLAAWPGFKRLDRLDLGLCNIKNAPAVVLLTASTLPKLKRLELNENDLGGPTARALAACKQLGGLTNLTLAWNDFCDADAKRLAASTTLPAVLPMDISFNHFTKAGVAKLRARFGEGVVSREQFG
jgi:uncharacterized protein (TIGR02996 family)